jgi:hypothetical protein
MPVFLSHRRADSGIAVTIDRKLKLAGIQTYLDVLDPDVQNTENVTAKILVNLELCTHLMAILSATTAGSWWVPFEIGAATRGAKRISSYRISAVGLPEYLKMWPVLSNDGDHDKFIRRYRADGVVLEKLQKHAEARLSESKSPADFHRLLKRDLGQQF